MCNIVVYLGPSLKRSIASNILRATFRPPIRRGDLNKLPSGTKAIAIVDGEFYQSLAVSTKEILPFLDDGISVYGAASMGALRASELHVYGMKGVGEIFEMYRDGILDGDDEVAQAYDSETDRTCSEPLVNIRHVISLATTAGIIREDRAEVICREMKRVYFPERSYEMIWRKYPDLKLFFQSGPPNLKAIDTTRLLRVVAADNDGIDMPRNTRTSGLDPHPR